MQVSQRMSLRDAVSVQVRDRGVIAAGLRGAYNSASRQAWQDVGEKFHAEMRDARFTPEHAREAGYTARRGENLSHNDKRFRGFYYGRKYYSPDRGGGPKQADPLVDSGETREAVRATPNYQPTRWGVRIPYPGARVFNYRHPKSQVRMHAEFTRITIREARELADHYDRQLDEYWK